MRIEVGFEVDNDAFGQGHHDPQFGHHIATLLKEVATRFSDETRTSVGEDDVIHEYIYDGNGNVVGRIAIMGYKSEELNREEKVVKLFEDQNFSDIVEAMAEALPDQRVALSIITSRSLLQQYLKTTGTGAISDDDLDAVIESLN